MCHARSNLYFIDLSGGIIGGITIAVLLLLVVAGQFFVVLVFIGYKTRGMQSDFSLYR